MKNIKKDIDEQNFKRIYLIYGDEKYLVRNVKNMLVKGIVASGDNMNFTKSSGKECDPKKMIDMAQTLPFFADYRLILLENTMWCKESNDEVASYIKEIPETTVIVLVESEVDKRNKVYKQIKEHGYICECKAPTPSELSSWILKKLTRDGRKITRDNMNYLINKLGAGMDNISSELDKLVSYTYGREIIERQDIDAVCVGEISGKIFEMIDAIGNKNQKKAMDLYYDLISVREAPMKILYMLSRQFNIMLQLKEAQTKGVGANEIASKMGMQYFIVNKTISQCKNFKLSTIRNALSYCAKLEEGIKTGTMSDLMAVELVIVRYSEKK